MVRWIVTFLAWLAPDPGDVTAGINHEGEFSHGISHADTDGVFIPLVVQCRVWRLLDALLLQLEIGVLGVGVGFPEPRVDVLDSGSVTLQSGDCPVGVILILWVVYDGITRIKW